MPCPSHLILLDLGILIISEMHKLWSSSIRKMKGTRSDWQLLNRHMETIFLGLLFIMMSTDCDIRTRATCMASDMVHAINMWLLTAERIPMRHTLLWIFFFPLLVSFQQSPHSYLLRHHREQFQVTSPLIHLFVTTNNHFALQAVLDAFSKFKYCLRTHCPYELANYTAIHASQANSWT